MFSLCFARNRSRFITMLELCGIAKIAEGLERPDSCSVPHTEVGFHARPCIVYCCQALIFSETSQRVVKVLHAIHGALELNYSSIASLQ